MKKTERRIRKGEKIEKMNDRLKFKVWDKKNKKFDSEGFYIDCDGALFFDSWDDGLVKAGNNYKVVQCTGLKDKNYKLIFEGDIFVKKYFYPYYNYKNEGEKTQSLDDTNGEIKGEPELCCAGVVEQDEEGFCFKLHHVNERHSKRLSQLYSELDADTASECEVIGNIYENSELLRGEND